MTLRLQIWMTATLLALLSLDWAGAATNSVRFEEPMLDTYQFFALAKSENLDDNLLGNLEGEEYVDLINPKTGQIYQRPGAFLSDDPITSVNQVRYDLGVRTDWKANPLHVQEFEIKLGTQVQSSKVGPQTNPDGTYLPGLGNQTQILPQKGQFPSDVLKLVGPAVPIK